MFLYVGVYCIGGLRFLTRRKRNWESEKYVLLPNFLLTPGRALILLRSLVRFPPGRRKETAATQANLLRGFLRMSRGEMASKIPEMFDAFGPQLNTLISVGNLFQPFRLNLLQFEWSTIASNLVMSRFISLTKLCSAASFTIGPHYSTPSFT